MSLPLRKRTVHFYELHLSSTTLATVTNPSCARLVDLLGCFASMIPRSSLPRTIRKSTHLHTVLADWSYDSAEGCYELLISKANAALSDVALRNMGTSSLRKAGKTKAEGIEVSAHVLVRPNSNANVAAVLLTMGAGVNPTDIEMLFKTMSRAASKLSAWKHLFYFDDPSGAKGPDNQPLQYKVRYGFAIHAYPGQTLTSALQNGEFESMDLIAQEQSKFDTGGNLQITERSLSVKAQLPQSVTGASVRNAVRAFQKTPDGSLYRKLRLRYKTVAGDPATATLDINNLDAAFTLKDHIDFDTDLDAQQNALSPIILAGMKPLLRSVPT